MWETKYDGLKKNRNLETKCLELEQENNRYKSLNLILQERLFKNKKEGSIYFHVRSLFCFVPTYVITLLHNFVFISFIMHVICMSSYVYDN